MGIRKDRFSSKIGLGSDSLLRSSGYSSRNVSVLRDPLTADDVKYKSYGARGRLRRDRDRGRDPLSNSSASYLHGYETRPKYSLRSSASSKYGGYDSYDAHNLSSSLPSSYCKKYLENEYKLHHSQGKSQPFYSSSLEPRSILSSSFDPKASYISDMESREFGSHVDMIQSLQLRSSLTEQQSESELASNTSSKPHLADFLLKSDLQLSLDNPFLPKETLNIRPAIPTPGSTRVSFLSPCIESTVQLTEPFSSYTSSPTSPFSEPFPNPQPFQSLPLGLSDPPLSSLRTYPRNSDLNQVSNTSYHLEPPLLPDSSQNCIPAYSPAPASKYDLSNFTSSPATANFHPAPPESLDLTNRIKTSSKAKEDQTLNILKKYYLEALLAQQTDLKLPYEEHNLPSNCLKGEDIVDYKKLYEDCHTENKQLSQDILSVKLQLQQVKHQLEGGVAAEDQTFSLYPTPENINYDKKNMERKLMDIRNELKVFTLSGNVTSEQLEKLGREIEELKYENRNLSQNVMDLMPDENNEDPRIHQYNNKDSNSI